MIQIIDPGATLTTGQVQTLTAKAMAYPFEIRVLIGTGQLSRGMFEAQVDAAVAPGSRIVSIGVDPTHHYSHVHASAALGLPSGPTVAAAGNPFFKQGNLVEGIDAIAAKANDLKVETRTVQSQSGVPIVIHEHKTATGVWCALGAFGSLVVAVVLWSVWRSKKRDAETQAERVALAEEAAELRARNIEEQEWADKVAGSNARPASVAPMRPVASSPSYRPAPFVSYPPSHPTSAAAPVIINNQVSSGNNGGLDLLVGMELERAIERDSYRPPVVVERVVVERESSSSSTWGGSDDSSSSSSFDSGSSDSSSSSDWGSSGGGDSSGGSDW